MKLCNHYPTDCSSCPQGVSCDYLDGCHKCPNGTKLPDCTDGKYSNLLKSCDFGLINAKCKSSYMSYPQPMYVYIVLIQGVMRPTMVRIVKYPAVNTVKHKADVIVLLQVVYVSEVVNT